MHNPDNTPSPFDLDLQTVEQLNQVIPRPDFSPTSTIGTFRSRETLKVTTGGQTQDWIPFKGGVIADEDASKPSYEVLVTPDTQNWLKIVPTQATNQEYIKTLTERLRIATQAQIACLELAGFHHLASQCVFDEQVQLRNKQTAGFISPYLGASVESIVEKLTGSKEAILTDPAHKKMVATVYSHAFNLALELYLQHNYWTDDPNPGNILIKKKNGTAVVLIDFSNSEQQLDASLPHLDPVKMGHDRFVEIATQQIITKVEQLRTSFEKHLHKHEQSLFIDDEALKQRITDHVTQLSRQSRNPDG